jgi:hypothetical protein
MTASGPDGGRLEVAGLAIAVVRGAPTAPGGSPSTIRSRAAERAPTAAVSRG